MGLKIVQFVHHELSQLGIEPRSRTCRLEVESEVSGEVQRVWVLSSALSFALFFILHIMGTSHYFLMLGHRSP